MSDLKATLKRRVPKLVDEIDKVKSIPAGSRTEAGDDPSKYLQLLLIMTEVEAASIGDIGDIVSNMTKRIADEFDTIVSVTAVDLNSGTFAATAMGFDLYDLSAAYYYEVTLPEGTLS
ncbi:hypothetical protein [Burkholderia ambifaria]|uniref:hypothetical protein n=1 Tax=Burkholderia ambifaria TaxID=152480 RepID=UPI001589F37A|nr:hypothetical protein [Burkholderia ambifaria]